MSETKKKNVKEETVKKEQSKKVNVKKQAPKKSKPKIDYKKKFEELEESYERLSAQLMTLEIEKQNDIADFKEQAKGFQAKAQVEVNKVKEELRTKFEEDSIEAKKYGPQKIVESIAPTLFNIDLAVKSGLSQGPEVQAYVKGFEMLLGQLYTGLSDNGIEIIEPTIGETYDPILHQAFSTEEGEANAILKVKKKGIKLHDRVLLPASVIIGK